MEGGFGRAYKNLGVEGYYKQSPYNNPHKYDIERLIRKKLGKGNNYLTASSQILDLGCGAGEATLPLLALGYKYIEGCDPFLQGQFMASTKLTCHNYDFLQIMQGSLDDRHFDAILCSYSLHLAKESILHSLCAKLATLTRLLIIISPHKFPIIPDFIGWKLLEHSCQDKIHFRVYTAQNPLQ